jgi:phosphate transport system permease protein
MRRTRPATPFSAGPGFGRRKLIDHIVTGAVAAATALAVAVLLVILGYIVVKGWAALNVAFFTQAPLPIGEVGGGVAPAILGTVSMLLVASLIGVPAGIGAAVYLAEVGNGRFPSLVRFSIDLIAGMPSIVIGVFVWSVVVRRVVGNYNGLAGGIALSVIMTPIVCRTVEEILRLVPDNLREASLALGLPRWKTVLRVVMPTARAGMMTGVLLAVARAGGETAPLLLTALGNQFFSVNLLQPMAALPVQIYNYAVSPYDDWHAKAWGSALVLILVIGVLNLSTRLVVSRLR